jgi:hypothetical protein
MDRDEYQPNLVKCWLLASMTMDIPTSEMLQAMTLTETTGPMIDPTLWIRKSDAMAEDKKIVEAVATLRAAYLKMLSSQPVLVRSRLA